jgi:hypothetical protein
MMPGLDLFAFRSPGYAVFLAGSLPLGGIRLVLAIQGALAGIAAMLWADLAARAGGLRAGAITAAAILGLGLTWRFSSQLMSETLYVPLLALGAWLAIDVAERSRGGRAPGPWRVLALGATIAAAVLTRPAGLALAAACAALALLSPPARRSLASALVVAVVLWSPWPLRNAAVLGAPVPSLTSGGMNAWAGATGRPIHEAWVMSADSVALGERGLDRMFWRLARDEGRMRPAAVASLTVHKLHDYVMPPAPRAAEWPHILLWGPALAAPFVMRRRRGSGWALPGLPLFVWAGHALLATVTLVSDRYRFPTDPIVLALGGIGIDALLKRHGAARGSLAVAGWVTFGVLLALTRHH